MALAIRIVSVVDLNTKSVKTDWIYIYIYLLSKIKHSK